MLFFTNGRQGLNLLNKKYNNILSLEDKIENIVKANHVNFGHVGGLDLYPYSRNAPEIEKITEQEFIL